MEAGKNVYEVQVAGIPLKLRSSHDKATVDELIQFVDQKINEVAKAAPHVSFQNALLLASLNIAEDLLMLKRVAREELAALEGRAERILEQIEEARL